MNQNDDIRVLPRGKRRDLNQPKLSLNQFKSVKSAKSQITVSPLATFSLSLYCQ